jgi:hypothetical protein
MADTRLTATLRRLTAMTAAGHHTERTDGRFEPAYSPDGKKIAIRRHQFPTRITTTPLWTLISTNDSISDRIQKFR